MFIFIFQAEIPTCSGPRIKANHMFSNYRSLLAKNTMLMRSDEKNSNVLFDDMRKNHVKFPAPIIPLGNRRYMSCPETRNDVKAIQEIYKGEVFHRISPPFGHYRFSDVCGMEHDELYIECQQLRQQRELGMRVSRIEVSEKMAPLINTWIRRMSQRMSWTMERYGKIRWVEELSAELSSYYARPFPRPTKVRYVPSD